MSQFEIYDEKLHNKEEPVRLRLLRRYGSIMLCVVGKNGEPVPCGSILTISDRGIQLIGAVSPDIGLPLDNRGRVTLEE